MVRERQQPRWGSLSTVAAIGVRRLTAGVLPRSTGGVLGYLICDAKRPDWSPLAAARRLSEYANADLGLLRLVEVRLRSVAPRYPAAVQRHALAAIRIAIADLEETSREESVG